MAVQSPDSPNHLSSSSSPTGDDTCSSSQHSLNEEKRLSELYAAKFRQLHQKVSDLTQLYEESERDAASKLQFWQEKFISTLQALNDSPAGSARAEESPQALERMRDQVRALEHQLSLCITQGEEEASLHLLNRELLSKLKQSHQEKRQLTEDLLRLNGRSASISSGVEECSRQLERMSQASSEREGERVELESVLQQVRNENFELTQGLLTERRDGDHVRRERDRAKRELCELRSELRGREDELEGRERDNQTMVQRLESLRQEIDQLRRSVAARGRSCHEHKQGVPSDLADYGSGELTDVREEMVGLLDELAESRDKLQSYEESLARLREEQISQALANSVQVAGLEQRLREAELELEAHKRESNERMRRKSVAVESSQQQTLESEQRLAELSERFAQLQQRHRDKSVACEQLEHRVGDLNKALQTSLETQEQLAESFQSKQQDIDKLTGQANSLQKQLHKTTGKHILTRTQLQALNQQLQLETDRVRGYEEKLEEASQEKEKLQREIILIQEKSRVIPNPHEEDPLGGGSPPEEARSVGVMNSLNLFSELIIDKKNSPNFSQNYTRALEKGLSQVELGESTSKVQDHSETSPDSKLYWVRRVSEMSMQMKESSEYWSAQVKELTLQIEQLKQSQAEQVTDT